MKRFKSIARRAAIGAVAVTAVGAVAVTATYLLDMDRAYDRIQGTSTVVPSPYGDIEYTEHGSGKPRS
jgi:hypothetical protein